MTVDASAVATAIAADIIRNDYNILIFSAGVHEIDAGLYSDALTVKLFNKLAGVVQKAFTLINDRSGSFCGADGELPYVQKFSDIDQRQQLYG